MSLFSLEKNGKEERVMRDGWSCVDNGMEYISKSGRHYSLQDTYTYGIGEKKWHAEVVCFEYVTDLEDNSFGWRGNFVGWCATSGDDNQEEIDSVCEYFESIIEEYERKAGN